MTHHPDPYVVNWSEKVAGLVELARDDREWCEAVAALVLRPSDRVAVDVGCGGGGMTLALAAALAGRGEAAVVAVDGASARHRCRPRIGIGCSID